MGQLDYYIRGLCQMTIGTAQLRDTWPKMHVKSTLKKVHTHMQLLKTQSKDVHKRSLWVKFCNTNTCSSYCAVSSECTIWSEKNGLTLSTLTPVWIPSILFSIHFLRCWQGDFVQQSLVGNHFLYSCDLNVAFRGDIVGETLTMLVTPGSQRLISIWFSS